MKLNFAEVTCALEIVRFFQMEAEPSMTMRMIKDAVHLLHGLPPRSQRYFMGSTELNNNILLQACGIEEDDTIFIVPNIADADGKGRAIVIPLGEPSASTAHLVASVQRGFDCNFYPKLADDGTGGTYFLKGEQKQNVAVFKPRDEEPLAPNNPRGFAGRLGQPGLRKGVLSGEGWLREVGAYLLDHGSFHGVPATVPVEICHSSFESSLSMSDWEPQSKIGSLQEFVRYDEIVGDVGTANLPVHEVHKIGILDIRILNCDRNDNNILVRMSSPTWTLTPIDHAYSMGDRLDVGDCDWVWMSWQQAHEPFSSEALEYIADLDMTRDLSILRDLGIRSENLRRVALATLVLKRGAAAGLNLFQIGSILCRNVEVSSLRDSLSQGEHGDEWEDVWNEGSRTSELSEDGEGEQEEEEEEEEHSSSGDTGDLSGGILRRWEEDLDATEGVEVVFEGGGGGGGWSSTASLALTGSWGATYDELDSSMGQAGEFW